MKLVGNDKKTLDLIFNWSDNLLHLTSYITFCHMLQVSSHLDGVVFGSVGGS